LEEEGVTGVGVELELRLWNLRNEPVGVDDWIEAVNAAVGDERGHVDVCGLAPAESRPANHSSTAYVWAATTTEGAGDDAG